jgi:CPA2 family monovalent cation:H+ antiporter-2
MAPVFFVEDGCIVNMPHDINLITTIAAALGLAMVMGFVVSRLKMPPLVGYLIAGVVIGPATPGFVADAGLASQLAEIGVMLLMFGVGLHFSLDDLIAVRRIAVPGAIVQIAAATALGVAIALFWGWSIGAALAGRCKTAEFDEKRQRLHFLGLGYAVLDLRTAFFCCS